MLWEGRVNVKRRIYPPKWYEFEAKFCEIDNRPFPASLLTKHKAVAFGVRLSKK